jgi:hypothetical protein
VKVDYRLTGHGWADCDVEIAGQRASMVASYLSDALADMLAATTAVVKGAAESTFSFHEEPAEVRWCLRRAGPERMRVRILRLEDAFADLPDEVGEVLLDADCRTRTFAGQVLSAAQEILRKHGTAGYRREWGLYDFPDEQMRALQAALAI